MAKAKNEIYIYSSYAMMVFRNRKGEAYNVYLSLEDVERVQQHRWSVKSNGYVYNTVNDMLLHRFIMNSIVDNQELDVDHIDHNPLNNMRSNLRLATRTQNRMNGSVCGKSGVLNIRWIATRKSWRVEFKRNGSRNFANFTDALEWRNARAIELYGEFANIQDQFELITVDYRVSSFLEDRGFHYISKGENGFTYILSDELKKLLKK